MTKQKVKPARVAAAVSVAVLAAGAGGIAYGRFGLPYALDMPPALAGERRVMERRAGPLSYYVAGEGAPILLVHSINAAASSYEMKPLFDALVRDHRVYAVDLPGFGFSDRSDRPYRVGLYVAAIHDMLDEIADRQGAGAVDAVALSLSSEFLARAAIERPDGLRTLAFVTPTGFDRLSAAVRGQPGATREVRGLHATVSVPLWGRGLFNLLVTRPSIRFFLEKTWGSKRIDEGLFAYDYLSTHQPGAEHAPFAFVSGRLFSGDIRDVYGRLDRPVLVMHGTKGDFQDFSEIGWTRQRPNWRVIAYPTGAMVHFEERDRMVEDYRSFVAEPPA